MENATQAADDQGMETSQAPSYWQQPPPTWAPAPQRPQTSAGVIVLLVLILFMLTVDTVMIFYTFRVAYGIAHIGQTVSSYLGGN